MRTIVLCFLLLTGCASGGDIWLKGDLGTRFRALTKHEAITLGENLRIYGTKEPPIEQILCHERAHSAQAKVIGDLLVKVGAIDDDPESRTAAFLSLYLQDWLIYGYDNRWEKSARAACQHM